MALVQLGVIKFQLNRAYAELEKRINEHDTATASGFERTDITLQVCWRLCGYGQWSIDACVLECVTVCIVLDCKGVNDVTCGCLCP